MLQLHTRPACPSAWGMNVVEGKEGRRGKRGKQHTTHTAQAKTLNKIKTYLWTAAGGLGSKKAWTLPAKQVTAATVSRVMRMVLLLMMLLGVGRQTKTTRRRPVGGL